MLTTADVAKVLQVSDTTVREYADEGLIPCTRTPKGGHRRFELGEVLDAVARRQGRWSMTALEPGEAPRLDETDREPLHLAVGEWRPTMDRAQMAEAGAMSETPHEISVPFIGVRGASRFAVGEGARI